MALSIFSSTALSFYVISHRLVEYFKNNIFYPTLFLHTEWLFFVLVITLQVFVFWLMTLLTLRFEKQIKHRFQDSKSVPVSLGLISFSYSFILAAIEFAAAGMITLLDMTLLNVWDILFIFIFIGVFYVGCNFYFYYGVPLDFWENTDGQIQMENLKIEYDLQKTYLNKFLWITFSIIVSQVFVIFKSRYDPYLQDPIKYAYLMNSIVVNAVQLCFILLCIWSTIFAKILGRIEEIKIQFSSLGMKSQKKSK